MINPLKNNARNQAVQIIKRYNLDKHKWVRKSLHSVLHTMFPATINLFRPLKEYWGDSMRLFVFFIIDDYLYWYYNEEDMARLRKGFVEKITSDPSFVEKFEKDWRGYVKKFEEKCRKVDETDLSGLSDEELLRLYTEFYVAYVKEYSLAMGLVESFSMQVNVFFMPMVEKVLGGRDLNSVYNLLLSPVDESFINKEFKGRLEIIKAIKGNESKEKIDQMLEEHAKRYFWTENNYAKVKVLDKEYFKEKIMKEIGLGVGSGKLSDIEDVKKRKNELIEELDLNQEMRNIIKATERFAIIQDDRKKCVLISNHYQKMFLKEIGKRMGVSEKDMDYTIFPELKEVFDGKKLGFENRRKASLVIETLEGYELFDGDTALEVFNEVFKEGEGTKEVKGVCASRGKAKGVVKIIRKTHDLASVNKGDILVTSMTRPEMITAMEKAKAIVTDEGGVTCHAAVISRELGIPCIIATKNATQVLKNCDLVEVDADNGVVRRV